MVIPSALIKRLSKSYLSRISGYPSAFRDMVEVAYTFSNQTFPFILDEGHWRILDGTEPSTKLSLSFVKQDRNLRYEISGDVYIAFIQQFTDATEGQEPTDVTGDIMVYYDNSFDFRDNGMDLGDPIQD